MSAQGVTLCRVTSLSEARYWSVVGQFIDNETKRRGWTDLNFALNASLSRATIARLKAGGALGEASLAKIEGALDLPRDLLSYIALGEEFEIVEATRERDPDLIRWLRKKFVDADREIETRRQEEAALIRIAEVTRDPRDDLDDDLPAAARRGRKDRPDEHAQ